MLGKLMQLDALRNSKAKADCQVNWLHGWAESLVPRLSKDHDHDLSCFKVSTCSHVAMQPDLPDSPIDLAEDLPDDVLARVLAHGRAREAGRCAATARALRAAAESTAQRLWAQLFGASTCHGLDGWAKAWNRLDLARSEELGKVKESFVWAAGHGLPEREEGFGIINLFV